MYDYMFLGKDEGADEQLEEVRQAILQFKGKIPGIVHISAGINTNENADYNWGVFIRFADLEARRAYRSHPVHRAVTDKYGHMLKESITVEYEQ